MNEKCASVLKYFVRKPLKTASISVVIFGFLYVFTKTLTLDAYGHCQNLQNLGLCLDGWINLEGRSTSFKKLISDDEMITHFERNRIDFSAVVEDVQQDESGANWVSLNDLPRPELAQRLRVLHITRNRNFSIDSMVCLHAFNSSLEKCEKKVFKWEFVRLWADVTRLIDGEFWPHSNLVKYYIYYPWEEPIFSQGKIYVYQPRNQGAPKNTYLSTRGDVHTLLVSSLDSDWPEGWPTKTRFPFCLMRRIEAHWYLQLCKNDIGG